MKQEPDKKAGVSTKLRTRALMRSVLSLTLLFTCSGGNALELGSLQVLSKPGQNLSAEIDFKEISPQELQNLRAKAASSEVYDGMGLRRPAVLDQIVVEVQKRSDGKSFLKLSSAKPLMVDNDIDALLEFSWATGKTNKSVKLVSEAITAAPTTATTSTTSSTPASIQLPQVPAFNNRPGFAINDPKTGQTIPQASSAEVQASQAADQLARITIKPGDDLITIARTYRPTGVNLPDMVGLLIDANPQAFENGLPDQLKIGAPLDLPILAKNFSSFLAPQASNVLPVNPTALASAPLIRQNALPAPEAPSPTRFKSKPVSKSPKSATENPISTAARTDTGTLASLAQKATSPAPAADQLRINTASPNSNLKTAEIASLTQARMLLESQKRQADIGKNLQELEASVKNIKLAASATAPNVSGNTALQIPQKRSEAALAMTAPKADEYHESFWDKVFGNPFAVFLMLFLAAVPLLSIYYSRRAANYHDKWLDSIQASRA